jgi:hypothetical protein
VCWVSWEGQGCWLLSCGVLGWMCFVARSPFSFAARLRETHSWPTPALTPVLSAILVGPGRVIRDLLLLVCLFVCLCVFMVAPQDPVVEAARHAHHRRLASLVPATATLSTGITYDPAGLYTPRVTSITPDNGYSGTAVVISGTWLRTTQGSVTIGGAPCVVSAWTNTSISCVVGGTAAGE